jgi:hypothetical protein
MIHRCAAALIAALMIGCAPVKSNITEQQVITTENTPPSLTPPSILISTDSLSQAAYNPDQHWNSEATSSANQLKQRLQKIYSSPESTASLQPIDLELKNKKAIIIDELESKSVAITALANLTIPATTDPEKVTATPYRFAEGILLWQERLLKFSEINIRPLDGWRHVDSDLKKLKKKSATDLDPAWLEIQRRVQSLLFDDENRILNQARYSRVLDNNELETIQLAAPTKSEFITRKNTSRYKYYNLELKLNSGSLSAEVQQFIQKSIESIWKTNDIEFKVIWGNEGFEFVFLNTPGGRSHTAYQEKKVYLFGQATSREIAHEVGHVIGFPDHYTSYFDPKTGDYLVKMDFNDLMSVHTSGEVTADEWQALRDLYLPPRQP